ncbi:MAG: hypothetical protein Q9227_000478 [Pyrenula ochraceoflavens]
MHKPSLSPLVYRTLYPRTVSSAPQNFKEHIDWYIIPEVRYETISFYGELGPIETLYPGFDYAYPPHRRRLSRYPNHRRLFRAFDKLRLTESDIWQLCSWEGTKSAKDIYEREQGTKIRDTTLDGIQVASPSRGPIAVVHEPSVSLQSLAKPAVGMRSGFLERNALDLAEETEESSDDLDSSGDLLNQQLLTAAEARMRGEDGPLDEQFDQWLTQTSNNLGGSTLATDPTLPLGTSCPALAPTNQALAADRSSATASNTATIDWATWARASSATVADELNLLSATTDHLGTPATASANQPAGEAR